MAEPMSSTAAGAAGGAMAWKAAGGAAGIAAGGASLATVVVMAMTMPKKASEWAVALISTVVCSLSLGNYLALYLGLHETMAAAVLLGDKSHLYMVMSQYGGVVFAAGLPGWFLVRAAFRWMDKRQNKDIGEIILEVKNGSGTDR